MKTYNRIEKNWVFYFVIKDTIKNTQKKYFFGKGIFKKPDQSRYYRLLKSYFGKGLINGYGYTSILSDIEHLTDDGNATLMSLLLKDKKIN